jgi:hypothetical protein
MDVDPVLTANMMIRRVVQHQYHLLTWITLVESHQKPVVQPLHVDGSVHVVVIVTVPLFSLVDELAGERQLVNTVVVDRGVVCQPAVLRECMKEDYKQRLSYI